MAEGKFGIASPEKLDPGDEPARASPGTSSSRCNSCPICTGHFSTESAMLEHVTLKHGDVAREVIVESETPTINDIPNIMKKARVHECPQCKVLFNCTFDFNLHMSGHRDSTFLVKPNRSSNCSLQTGFKCTVCGKIVGSQGNLKKHMVLHTGEKPYQCQICSKSFSIKGNRDKHMVIHTEQKPHECHICNKKFSLKGNLQQHILTHMDKKFFKCAICSKEFTLKGNLLKHVKRHEVGSLRGRRTDKVSIGAMEHNSDSETADFSVSENDIISNETRELCSILVNRINQARIIQSEMQRLHSDTESVEDDRHNHQGTSDSRKEATDTAVSSTVETSLFSGKKDTQVQRLSNSKVGSYEPTLDSIRANRL